MFGMSWGEIIIILAVGMFVLGPERIPVAVKWVGTTLKTVRTMAAGAQEQLRGEFGPELDELRRQIQDLQSLKEIQELRTLRDLNPRSMITKNLLGDEFSGGLSGFLGLNQQTTAPQSTGSGVASEPAVPAVQVNDPINLTKEGTADATGPGAPATSPAPDPVTINLPSNIPAPVDLGKPVTAVVDAAPVGNNGHPAAGPATRHAVFDLDAT